VHHALLVAGEVVGRFAGGGDLQQRLSDAGHVAVAEDAEAARDQPLLDAVALAVLVRQEPHEGLRHRQPYCLHSTDLLGYRNRRREVTIAPAWTGIR
jgi:hypothetical protein